MDLTKLQNRLPKAIYDQLPSVLPLGVDGPKRLAHLLGQCKLESGGFLRMEENLNYSAQGLANTWPSRYAVNPKAPVKVPNPLAVKLARNPVAIANNVYANRGGNGDEASGDGARYKGRGAIQTTLKDNYKALGDFLHVDLIANPELVATDYALVSAAFYFMNNHMWAICDKGVDDATCKEVTKVINKGLLDLEKRIQYTKEFYTWLTA